MDYVVDNHASLEGRNGYDAFTLNFGVVGEAHFTTSKESLANSPTH
jgi:hypothetical protein